MTTSSIDDVLCGDRRCADSAVRRGPRGVGGHHRRSRRCRLGVEPVAGRAARRTRDPERRRRRTRCRPTWARWRRETSTRWSPRSPSRRTWTTSTWPPTSNGSACTRPATGPLMVPPATPFSRALGVEQRQANVVGQIGRQYLSLVEPDLDLSQPMVLTDDSAVDDFSAGLDAAVGGARHVGCRHVHLRPAGEGRPGRRHAVRLGPEPGEPRLAHHLPGRRRAHRPGRAVRRRRPAVPRVLQRRPLRRLVVAGAARRQLRHPGGRRSPPRRRRADRRRLTAPSATARARAVARQARVGARWGWCGSGAVVGVMRLWVAHRAVQLRRAEGVGDDVVDVAVDGGDVAPAGAGSGGRGLRSPGVGRR